MRGQMNGPTDSERSRLVTMCCWDVQGRLFIIQTCSSSLRNSGIEWIIYIDNFVLATETQVLWVPSRLTFRSRWPALVCFIVDGDCEWVVAHDVHCFTDMACVLWNFTPNFVSLGQRHFQEMIYLIGTLVGLAAIVDVVLRGILPFRPPWADNWLVNEMRDVLEFSAAAGWGMIENVLTGIFVLWCVVTIVLEATASNVETSIVSEIFVPFLQRNLLCKKSIKIEFNSPS